MKKKKSTCHFGLIVEASTTLRDNRTETLDPS